MRRVIDFVKSLETVYYAAAPKRLWAEVYYIIRKHSVHDAIDFVKSLSKDLIGEELTDQEVISAMGYIEVSRGLASLVSPTLYAEYSPYLYIVRDKSSDGEFNAYKGFNTIESVFDYIESHPGKTFLIFNKHAKGVRMVKYGKNVVPEPDFGVYILYWREKWEGWADDDLGGRFVDGVEFEVNLKWLKGFFDTYGKQAVMEYVEYLFKEKEYLSSAINFWDWYLEKEVGEALESQLKVRIYVEKDADIFLDIYSLLYLDLDLEKRWELEEVLKEHLRQARLMPNDFLSFNAAMRSIPYIGL